MEDFHKYCMILSLQTAATAIYSMKVHNFIGLK